MLTAEQLASVRAAVGVLQRASPHGWLPMGTRQPEPAPLRGVVSGEIHCATPARVPEADEAICVLLNAASSLLAMAEAAAQLRAINRRKLDTLAAIAQAIQKDAETLQSAILRHDREPQTGR